MANWNERSVPSESDTKAVPDQGYREFAEADRGAAGERQVPAEDLLGCGDWRAEPPDLNCVQLNMIFREVGNAPSERIRRLNGDGVLVTRFVEGPPPYLIECATLDVVPFLRRAEVKMKTLEMLEAGLPVISTYAGRRGLITIKAGARWLIAPCLPRK